MRFFATLRMTLFSFLEVLPDQPVLSPARASKAIVQTTTTLAHPPYLPGRNTSHQSIIFYVPCHHGSSGDQRRAANGMAANDGAIGSEGCSLAYARTRINSMHREMRPRGTHVREYARRAAEYVILQLYAFVNGYVVLDTDAVSDPDVVRYIDILSQRTIAPNDGTFLNVAEMPDLRSCADGHAIVDITAFMDEEVLHSRCLFSNIAGAQSPRLRCEK